MSKASKKKSESDPDPGASEGGETISPPSTTGSGTANGEKEGIELPAWWGQQPADHDLRNIRLRGRALAGEVLALGRAYSLATTPAERKRLVDPKHYTRRRVQQAQAMWAEIRDHHGGVVPSGVPHLAALTRWVKAEKVKRSGGPAAAPPNKIGVKWRNRLDSKTWKEDLADPKGPPTLAADHIEVLVEMAVEAGRALLAQGDAEAVRAHAAASAAGWDALLRPAGHARPSQGPETPAAGAPRTPMVLSEAEQEVAKHLTAGADADGLLIPDEQNWGAVKALLKAKVITEDRLGEIFGDLLTGVPFPRRKTTDEEVAALFTELRAKPWYEILSEEINSALPASTVIDGPVVGEAGVGHRYNPISDHFQWHNRYACRGEDAVGSPLDVWEDPEKRRVVKWYFYGSESVTRNGYMDTFRLRGPEQYVAHQFRPQVAKGLIEYFAASVVVDPCCGWGDRLAGFYASSATVLVGSDPNTATWRTYQKQAEAYERLLSGTAPSVAVSTTSSGINVFRVAGASGKSVAIACGPAEDVPWDELVQPGTVDMVLTSPPYFGTERYAEGQASEENQSWSRYPTFESWKTGFLLPVVNKMVGLLALRGVALINIANPADGKFDAVTPLTAGIPGAVYDGLLHFARRRRPKKGKKGAVKTAVAEPLLMFRRSDGEEIKLRHELGVEAMFDREFGIRPRSLTKMGPSPDFELENWTGNAVDDPVANRAEVRHPPRAVQPRPEPGPGRGPTPHDIEPILDAAKAEINRAQRRKRRAEKEKMDAVTEVTAIERQMQEPDLVHEMFGTGPCRFGWPRST